MQSDITCISNLKNLWVKRFYIYARVTHSLQLLAWYKKCWLIEKRHDYCPPPPLAFILGKGRILGELKISNMQEYLYNRPFLTPFLETSAWVRNGITMSVFYIFVCIVFLIQYFQNIVSAIKRENQRLWRGQRIGFYFLVRRSQNKKVY